MKITIGIRSVAQVAAWSLLLLARISYSQQFNSLQETRPSVEVTYDFVRTNGPPGNCDCIHMNGGGVAYVYPIAHSQFSLIGGLAAANAGKIGSSDYDLTLLTYTGGARFTPHVRSYLFRPYAEVQLGGAHASGTLAGAPSLAGNGIGSSFAATAGGGLNLSLPRRISIKLFDVEYLATSFANGSTDHQNDLRFSAGLIIALCRSSTCSVSK